MSKSAVYFIHALSPLHPGVGQGVGSIDLPVAREKASGVPYLPGSSVKGVLRDAAMNTWGSEAKVKAVFGPETNGASEHAGAAYFGDARLILLPVRSYAGIFAYATSPYLLGRFKREAELAGLKPPALPPSPETPSDALVGKKSQVTHGDEEKGRARVYLEDLDFDAGMSDEVTEWEAWLIEQTKGLDLPLAGRLLYLHDDVMGFLLETALEVVTRIRIDENTKTVADGALWFEENIPAESVLYGLLSTAPETFATANGSKLPAAEILAQLGSLAKHTLQFGGNATVGRGLSRMILVSATEEA
ncbi:type III-B CRISPR module RAMP protein Cmr4 [Oceanithermus sp.]